MSSFHQGTNRFALTWLRTHLQCLGNPEIRIGAETLSSKLKTPLDDILFLLPGSVGLQRCLLQRSQSTPCPQISNPLNHTLLFVKLPDQHPNSFLYLDGSDRLIVFDIDMTRFLLSIGVVSLTSLAPIYDLMIYGMKSSIVLNSFFNLYHLPLKV